MKSKKNKSVAGASLSDVRSQFVVKANELIQKGRFSLTAQQQKIILYVISHITPYDEDFKPYKFSIPEFCRVCGIECDNGKNFKNFKDAIKGLADKSAWLEIADADEEPLMRWIVDPVINKKTGTIELQIDHRLKPYLLQLKENFTKYELVWPLRFRSKYSIRLYELAKSLQYNENFAYERVFDLDDLKGALSAEKHKTFQHFRDRALDPAVEEVNAYSDKNVSYTTIKEGRTIVKVALSISAKSSIASAKLRHDIEKDFGSEEMTLWERLVEKGYVRPELYE